MAIWDRIRRKNKEVTADDRLNERADWDEKNAAKLKAEQNEQREKAERKLKVDTEKEKAAIAAKDAHEQKEKAVVMLNLAENEMKNLHNAMSLVSKEWENIDNEKSALQNLREELLYINKKLERLIAIETRIKEYEDKRLNITKKAEIDPNKGGLTQLQIEKQMGRLNKVYENILSDLRHVDEDRKEIDQLLLEIEKLVKKLRYGKNINQESWRNLNDFVRNSRKALDSVHQNVGKFAKDFEIDMTQKDVTDLDKIRAKRGQ